MKIENGFPHLQYETATDQNCHILFQVTKNKQKKKLCSSLCVTCLFLSQTVRHLEQLIS